MVIKFSYLNRRLVNGYHGNILEHSGWDNDYGEFVVECKNYKGKSQHERWNQQINEITFSLNLFTIISCSRIGYDVKDNRPGAKKLVCFDHLEKLFYKILQFIG